MGRSGFRNAMLLFTTVLLLWSLMFVKATMAENECAADSNRSYIVTQQGLLVEALIEPKFDRDSVGNSLNYDCKRLEILGQVLHVFLLVWSCMMVLYGAARRTEIRERFHIKGSRLGDICTWFWCSMCAICQEARTLQVNNVVEGVWHGPTIAADMTDAPSVPVMDANAKMASQV